MTAVFSDYNIPLPGDFFCGFHFRKRDHFQRTLRKPSVKCTDLTRSGAVFSTALTTDDSHPKRRVPEGQNPRRETKILWLSAKPKRAGPWAAPPRAFCDVEQCLPRVGTQQLSQRGGTSDTREGTPWSSEANFRNHAVLIKINRFLLCIGHFYCSGTKGRGEHRRSENRSFASSRKLF